MILQPQKVSRYDIVETVSVGMALIIYICDTYSSKYHRNNGSMTICIDMFKKNQVIYIYVTVTFVMLRMQS